MPVQAPNQVELDRDELHEANRALAGLDPEARIRWAHDRFGDSLILSSSFGELSAIMLHLVSRAAPEVPVLTVDNGYLTPDTYRFKRELIDRLGLQVYTFVPQRTRAEREALEGSVIEALDDERRRRELAHEIKVEPFERGLKMMRAGAWMSGVMRGETVQRSKFDFLMRRDDGLYKVHPVLDWTQERGREYLRRHGLPVNEHYHDVVKRDSRECGIHLTGMNQSLTASNL